MVAADCLRLILRFAAATEKTKTLLRLRRSKKLKIICDNQNGRGMIGVRRVFCLSKRDIFQYSTYLKHLKQKRMVFECQRDSYKSELTTKVVSCEECGPNEYEIVLEDTVLFPEGGGQVSLFGYS